MIYSNASILNNIKKRMLCLLTFILCACHQGNTWMVALKTDKQGNIVRGSNYILISKDLVQVSFIAAVVQNEIPPNSI